MGLFSLSNILGFVCVVYLGIVGKNFYDIFNPVQCRDEASNQCLSTIPNWKSSFMLSICLTNKNKYPNSLSHCSQLIDLSSEHGLNESFVKSVQIKIPNETQNNGTLNVYVILHKKSSNQNGQFKSHSVIRNLKISKYKLNNTRRFVNLLNNESSGGPSVGPLKPITHLLTHLRLSVMENDIKFDKNEIPPEVFYDIVLNDKRQYLPIMYVDNLSMKDNVFYPLNESQSEFNLVVDYSPIKIGSIRLFRQLEASMKSMKDLGFPDSQLDEILSIFTDTNFYILFLTFAVSLIHMLFEFLAFKNDISFWRKQKNNIGLSLKTLIWRLFSQIAIFFYLLQEETSLLILVPSAISILIELWKVAKAFKIKLTFGSLLIPKIEFGESSKEEKECMNYDTIAMKRLSYVLYPLCIGGAIYSLLYNTHKSWYSWFINSLVNGIYAFGFLFMTPQLFMNYKMKSVAHLPWRAFMYKAFNTFIDDVFAFIIKMPTSHRLACLRDDIVFLIYLYQRWLYPIDTKRVNEYGQSFDDQDESKAQSVENKKDK